MQKEFEYSVKKFEQRNVIAVGKVTPAVDLNTMVRTYVQVEYRPERFPGLLYPMKNPKASVTFFSSGKLNIMSNNEANIARAARKMERILKEELSLQHKIDYGINNVVCRGELSYGLECGILGAIFPTSKKHFREGVKVEVGGGYFSIFPSGKFLSMGFKSYEKTEEELDEMLQKINQNLDQAKKQKTDVCMIERAEPLIAAYYSYFTKVDEYVKKIPNTPPFTAEERLLGRQKLEEFLKLRAEVKEGLGAEVETIAAGAIYWLCLTIGKKISQKDIGEFCGNIREVTVRKGWKILERTLFKES